MFWQNPWMAWIPVWWRLTNSQKKRHIFHWPYSPHMWWLHSGCLMTYLHRFCMVWLQFGLKTDRNEQNELHNHKPLFAWWRLWDAHQGDSMATLNLRVMSLLEWTVMYPLNLCQDTLTFCNVRFFQNRKRYIWPAERCESRSKSLDAFLSGLSE